MPTTPPTRPPSANAAAPPPGRPPRERWSFARLSPVQREALVLGGALALGLFVMPFLIWVAGNRVLGPYTHGDNPRGGPWALFADYVVGLAHGSAVFWVVALGPLALLLLVRGFLALFWLVPQLRREPPSTPARGPGRPPGNLR